MSFWVIYSSNNPGGIIINPGVTVSKARLRPQMSLTVMIMRNVYEQQITLLEWFLKDCVKLNTNDAENSALQQE